MVEVNPEIEELKSDMVELDEYADPVRIMDDDLSIVKSIQVMIEDLTSHREELGRVHQMLGNMLTDSNSLEVSYVNKKSELGESNEEVVLLARNLKKYRQEIGRIYQYQSNLLTEANRLEVQLSETRRPLVQKYNLETADSTSQWALDFEDMVFRKVSPNAPVIP